MSVWPKKWICQFCDALILTSDGIDPKTGQFDAGLLFIAFQKDPDSFVKIQTNLGADDKMNEYVTHIGSGLFACFGGVKEGGYIGQDLFE